MAIDQIVLDGTCDENDAGQRGGCDSCENCALANDGSHAFATVGDYFLWLCKWCRPHWVES